MARQIATGLAALALAASIAGCTRFPELEAAEAKREIPETYPNLVPLGPVLQFPADPQITPELAEDLERTGDALRQKAARPVPATTSVQDFDTRSESLRRKADALKARTE